MEENEKAAEWLRWGLETRLKAVEVSIAELGKMTGMGIMLIKVEQFELRKAVERDDEGTKKDSEDEAEVTAEVTEEVVAETVGEAVAEATSEAVAPSSSA